MSEGIGIIGIGFEERRSYLTELLLRSYIPRSLVLEQLVHTRHIDDFDRQATFSMTGGMAEPPSSNTMTIDFGYATTGYTYSNVNWGYGYDYLAEQAAREKAWKRRWQDYHSMRDETPYIYSRKPAPKCLVRNGFLHVPGLITQRKAAFSPSMRAHKNFMKSVVKSYRRSIRNVV